MRSVPWLRAGVGKTPADGGCIMQVIDWIDSEGWSDHPVCVHPVLRAVAIKVNDLASDKDRQKLLDLAPRLMNTQSDNVQLSANLAVWCAEKVLPIWEAKYPHDDRPRLAIEAARSRTNAANAAAESLAAADTAAANAAYAAAANAAYAAAANAANAAAESLAAADAILFEFLSDLLDEFDRLTGRVNTRDISEDQWDAVCEVMV